MRYKCATHTRYTHTHPRTRTHAHTPDKIYSVFLHLWANVDSATLIHTICIYIICMYVYTYVYVCTRTHTLHTHDTHTRTHAHAYMHTHQIKSILFFLHLWANVDSATLIHTICIYIICMYVFVYVHVCCVLIRPPIPYITPSSCKRLRKFRPRKSLLHKSANPRVPPCNDLDNLFVLNLWSNHFVFFLIIFS